MSLEMDGFQTNKVFYLRLFGGSLRISIFGLVGWLYFKHLLDVMVMTSSFWVKVP